MTGASKLFTAAAAVLAITVAGPVEAGHDHGGDGRGGGWHGGVAGRWWRLARSRSLARRWRLARQRPTPGLVQAWVGRFRVARDLRFGRIRSRLGRPGVCRPRRGLAGLAPRLGLERFWLGMGRGRLGVGWPAGGCFIRRDRRPPSDRRAAADLRSAAADRRRTSGDCPAADRCSPAAPRGRSSRNSGPAATYRRAARRGAAAADRCPAAACHRRCSGATARYRRAARLRALYRPPRPRLRDHRARLAAWWLHHRRPRNRWSDGGNIAFRPSGVRRGARRLSRPGAGPVPLGLGWGLAWRVARWRL